MHKFLLMALRRKKEKFVYILGRQEYPVTPPWESTPRGVSTCPQGSALAAHHSPITWQPLCSSGGPEGGTKPRGQEAVWLQPAASPYTSSAHSLLRAVSLGEGAKETQASQKPCGCSIHGHLPCPATQRCAMRDLGRAGLLVRVLDQVGA